MAPNSVYALPLRVGRDALKPGQYTAKLAVKSKKQHWTFTKDFEITRDRANQLNKTAVIEHHTNWGLSDQPRSASHLVVTDCLVHSSQAAKDQAIRRTA